MVVLTFLLTMLAAAADARPPFTSPKSPRPEYARGLTSEEVRAGWINLYDATPAPLGWPGSGFIQMGQLTFLTDGTTASKFGDYELRIDVASAGDLVVGGRRKVIRVPVGTSTHRVEGLGRGPIRLGERLAISWLSVRPMSLRPALGREPDAARAWKQISHPSLPIERQAKWEELADPAGLRAVGGPGAVELGGAYGDFVLQVEVTTRRPLANGGVFFRCKAGEFLNGYEAQVFNGCYDHDPAKPAQWATGAIDDRQNAVRLVSRDGEPFTMTIVATGPHIATWVNGVQVTAWTDAREPHDNPRQGRREKAGPIQLQSHDADTDVEFRNLRVAPLQ
jgi:hypothetical protein